ncbi:uncharacterized protein [Rutidosis leptorrhynchoides]|uniref:uncharacterized protein n=1 Tax=Rutidosis leptorrhynchoides TaxID=125765 RepID=UPI003A98E2DA
MDGATEMEDINHVSHEEHPLKLIENWKTIEGRIVRCGGCLEPISKSSLGECESTYGCITCNYFWHKKCAQLPSTFTHPSHLNHTLTLTIRVSVWNCDVCKDGRLLNRFSYYCSPCDFDACIKCVVEDAAVIVHKDEAAIKLIHEGHHPKHTLTLRLRSTRFHCDVCQTDENDFLYKCDDCDFLIHKTCAHLPPTIDLHSHHHQHPVVLVYSLPYKFHRFIYYCYFCEKYVRRRDWLYHCANCSFFAHIKCALNADKFSTPRDNQEYVVEVDTKELLHFPMSHAFIDPLKLISNSRKIAQEVDNNNVDNDDNMDGDDDDDDDDNGDNGNYDDETINEINHCSHDHPLILNVEHQGNKMHNNINLGDPIEVCNCCVRPLSFPYYSCTKDECSFVLHKYCSELPVTLQCHQLHPNHPLNLAPVDSGYHARCDGCNNWSNTFMYQCEICTFYLDVNCAFLPNTIKHKLHNHPLLQVIDPNVRCVACNMTSPCISYACKVCNFQLDLHCAIRSPQLVAHRYCEGHEISLTYHPIDNDHPQNLYCVICEEEMNPNLPLYYCGICKNSFHLNCINRSDYLFENICYNGITTVRYHKHPLTYVWRKKTPKYVCSHCGCDVNGYLVLECRVEACNFNICFQCHVRKNLEG